MAAVAVPGIVDADIDGAGVEFDVVAYAVSGLSGVYLWVCFPCRRVFWCFGCCCLVHVLPVLLLLSPGMV